MLACDLASMLALTGVPIAAWLHALTLVQLMMVALTIGTSAVFFDTAFVAYLPSIVDGDQLVEGNVKLQGSESAAQIAGPGLGGLLAQIFGAATGLLADAISFAVSAGCLLAIRFREAPRHEPRRTENLWSDIGEGLRFLMHDRVLCVLTLAPAIYNLAWGARSALAVIFLVRIIRLAPAVVGILVTGAGAGGIVGAWLTSRIVRCLGTARALVIEALLTCPFGLLIPLTGPGTRACLYALGAGVLSAGILIFNIVVVSFTQSYVPPSILGRVTATTNFVLYGTIPLGGLIGGSLGSLLGIRNALWIIVAGGFLPAIILWASPLRLMRDLPDSPAVPVSSPEPTTAEERGKSA
jgi:Na+/melibiose symporter-like transporter